jgi:MFS superfamily sulfate permease-like transporter
LVGSPEYAIPVSLAYAAFAGFTPQVGIYGYMLGALGYPLLGAATCSCSDICHFAEDSRYP